MEKNTFTCSNCQQEKKLEELAQTVPVFEDEPIKTCRECYNMFHNPQFEKSKQTRFLCAFCKTEVFSIKHKIKVSVSEPNELGLKNRGTYNFCSSCRKKVVEYNEAVEDDEPEIWE